MKFGDAVKKLTDSLGIPQCDACKERQKVLNEWSDKIVSMMKGSEYGGPLGIQVGGTSPNRTDGERGSRSGGKAAPGGERASEVLRSRSARTGDTSRGDDPSPEADGGSHHEALVREGRDVK